MKIVILQDDFPPDSNGGAGVVAASLARALQERGHAVYVITTTRTLEQVGTGEWEGVPVYRIYSNYHERWRAWRSLYNPRVVREVSRLLALWRPDVVHAHNVHYHLSYASLRRAKRGGAKVFLTAHDTMLISYGKIEEPLSWWRTVWHERLRYNPFRSFYIKRALTYVDGISAVSKALADALAQGGITDVKVIRNGIDRQLWEVSPEAVKTFLQEHTLIGRAVLLFGGRISAYKGGDALLSALPAIREAQPRATLLLVGKDNEYVKALKVRAENLGFSDAIVSTGWLSGEALRAAYHAASAVVVPSVYLDPLPTVVLEAMACSKPVVGSCLGGIPEMVVDGETGYLVDPRDAELFARRVAEVLGDTALQHTLGQNGYDRIGTHFSLEKQVSTVLEWYEQSR